MIFRQMFDRTSCTYTYLLADAQTGAALLIDPVQEHIERDIRIIQELGLTLHYVLDKHVHADHVTSAGRLRERLGVQTVLSSQAGVGCANIYAEHRSMFRMDSVELEVRHTPGHTNGCVTYVDHANKRAFTGDTLLIRGCGRTDFQQGSSSELYHSIHNEIFSLPADTKLYPGHDYNGLTMTTVAEELKYNSRLGWGKNENEFCDIMSNLDLSYPANIDEALPANMMCGTQSTAEHRDIEVDVEWVRQKKEKGVVNLVDCRETVEWRSGHIVGAHHLPMSELEYRYTELESIDNIVFYCRTGRRSLQAVQWLMNKGYSSVSMAGGILAYESASLV